MHYLILLPDHFVYRNLGSQNYRGQNKKCCEKKIITIKKVKFDLPTTYRFIVIEGDVKGQILGNAGVKQVKMLQFCW